ncbi:MAG: glycosyltransferase family 39 protein [Verrucomicrobiota bacterium]
MRENTNYRRWTILILLALTLFRFWFCTYHELIEDEAQYRLWSKHLDWSYYSKGPLVSWTIFVGTSIMGDTVFGIRWISVLLSAATGWMIFCLGSRLWNERIGFYALIIVISFPLYAVGSVLMTIDPLSVFFWILAAHLFLSAVEKNKMSLWIGCGLAVGFGILGKFVNALELLSFLFFLLSDSDRRVRLKEKGFYLMLLVAVICMAPILYWNADHGWITLTHLQERGKLDRHFEIQISEILKFLKMQAITITPLYFLGMIVMGVSTTPLLWKSTRENQGLRYAVLLFLPTFLLYFILSFNDKGEANWTATGLIGGILLLAYAGVSLVTQSRAKAIGVAIIFGLAFLETVLCHDPFGLGVPLKSDPAARLRGWSDLAHKVDAVRQPGDVVIGNKYQTASILAFYLQDRPTTYVPKTEKIQNQFSFWPSYKFDAETHGILVTDSIDEVPDALKTQFSSIEKIADFYRQDRGRDLKQYQIYRFEKPIGY